MHTLRICILVALNSLGGNKGGMGGGAELQQEYREGGKNACTLCQGRQGQAKDCAHAC